MSAADFYESTLSPPKPARHELEFCYGLGSRSKVTAEIFGARLLQLVEHITNVTFSVLEDGRLKREISRDGTDELAKIAKR